MDGLRLDLGSGPAPIADAAGDATFVGLDCAHGRPPPQAGRRGAGWWARQSGRVVRWDLRRIPWPLPDASVAEIHCVHLLQFLTPAEWVALVDETWRVLAPACPATFVWPYLKTGRSWQDPRCADHFGLERWSYADAGWRVQMGLDGQAGLPSCDLDMVLYDFIGLHDDLLGASDAAKRFAIEHYWDAAVDVRVEVRKRVERPDGVNAESPRAEQVA